MDWIGLLTENSDVGCEHILSAFDQITGDNLPFSELPETIDALKPCPLCHGRDFIHGYNGGYFCITCQPDARPGVPVKAGGYRAKKELDDSNGNVTKM